MTWPFRKASTWREMYHNAQRRALAWATKYDRAMKRATRAEASASKLAHTLHRIVNEEHPSFAAIQAEAHAALADYEGGKG